MVINRLDRKNNLLNFSPQPWQLERKCQTHLVGRFNDTFNIPKVFWVVNELCVAATLFYSERVFPEVYTAHL